jgi:hypothetical protein
MLYNFSPLHRQEEKTKNLAKNAGELSQPW